MAEQTKHLGATIQSLEKRQLLASVPSGFVDTRVMDNLSSPTAMSFAPDGRLFVLQQGGRIRILKNGAPVQNNAIALPVNTDGERGLLGIAFDPAFASNQYLYLYYTTSSNIHNRLSRFKINGDVIDTASEKVLMDLPNLNATNHNGGALQFGKDGKLYVAVGDNAVGSNSQSLGTVFGKMLRLNSDGTIPTDNPFYNQTTGINRSIWATGLRNPYTFDVQPTTGKMYINDVGQNTVEEVNEGKAGANYGWPGTEGPTSAAGVTGPVYSYAHPGQGAAIAGAAFYNSTTASSFPTDYHGDYFFGDYVYGNISKLDSATKTANVFATNTPGLVDLAVSADGNLYYLARNAGTNGSGAVGKISYAVAGTKPSVVTQPQSQTVAVDQSVTFSVSASGTGPLTYQWFRDGRTLAGETKATYTINTASLATNGKKYTVRVSNSLGSVTSKAATLTVTNNKAPVATITSPTAGTKYKGGQKFTFTGTGTDAEDGTLSAGKFTWRVDFHHDTHTHPFVAETTGVKSGSFVIPTTGETAPDVFYRIYLTVTDSKGLKTTVTRDVFPTLTNVKIQSNFAGLQVGLDGAASSSPINFTGVAGITRELLAPATQFLNGIPYRFSRWSDGGPATHDISTPSVATTYTAYYVRV